MEPNLECLMNFPDEDEDVEFRKQRDGSFKSKTYCSGPKIGSTFQKPIVVEFNLPINSIIKFGDGTEQIKKTFPIPSSTSFLPVDWSLCSKESINIFNIEIKVVVYYEETPEIRDFKGKVIRLKEVKEEVKEEVKKVVKGD